MALVLLLPPSVLSIGKAGDIVDVTDEKADSLVKGGWGRRLYDERAPKARPVTNPNHDDKGRVVEPARAAAHQQEAEKFAGNIRDALPDGGLTAPPGMVMYDLSVPDDEELDDGHDDGHDDGER
jgi:hypothetical protein